MIQIPCDRSDHSRHNDNAYQKESDHGRSCFMLLDQVPQPFFLLSSPFLCHRYRLLLFYDTARFILSLSCIFKLLAVP